MWWPVAVQAQEAVGEDAAAQEGAKLLLDEARRGALSRPRAGEEGLDLLANDAVQERLLRGMRCVLEHGTERCDPRAALGCTDRFCRR